MGPSLGGLFAAGFPTLRPTAHRDLAGKISVSRSNSSSTLRPLWNPPTSADPISIVGLHRTGDQRLLGSSSAPPSPSHSSKHPPPFPTASPPTPPPTPPSAPPPPPAFQDRPASKPPPLPSCPPPPPPYQVTKPTWLPVHHCHSVSQPSTPPPPPPPPPPVQGDRSSGCFYSPPASAYSEPSRFPILRDSPLGPPPPPPAPPLPASFSPSCPSTLPPPPPRAPSVPSLSVRSLPPSYPCNAPTRRPPAVPRSAGASRLAPPPAPPARSPTTELSCRIPPPPPPLPPFSLRNGHLHGLDDFESKFQFHPVEDLPPPDEFKPFPRIYPSKENRVNPKPPGIRTHLR
ncbi:WAS/WASL-interacting protein family member 3 [Oryzias melastigma]|uniref:WAS/WASL-interacting protein family member 3 n=1 Tax=Oryzias melastigma TaxID=30732 RepID=UPI00168D1E25|nr:WAS/WASL-interacting protein family member 3 [Oryzias melastigma]